jgi:hypothetical protein
MPLQATTRTGASQEVERVLARFELGCPALRDHQVAVAILGPRESVTVLPASGKPKGRIELVVTPKGRLRSCLHPGNLTTGQRAAVEDLAWALYEALGREVVVQPKARQA